MATVRRTSVNPATKFGASGVDPTFIPAPVPKVKTPRKVQRGVKTSEQFCAGKPWAPFCGGTGVKPPNPPIKETPQIPNKPAPDAPKTPREALEQICIKSPKKAICKQFIAPSDDFDKLADLFERGFSPTIGTSPVESQSGGELAVTPSVSGGSSSMMPILIIFVIAGAGYYLYKRSKANG